MKHLISIIGLGALYALTALFLIYSYHYITSGVATTIHFLYPICVSFLMVVFFKDIGRRQLSETNCEFYSSMWLNDFLFCDSLRLFLLIG